MTHTHDIQGWKAHLDLGFKRSTVKTILASRSQTGPLTVQRPFYPEGDVCHLYLLHPPGGVVGGDELHINVALNDEAQVLITTPGATKFYRSGDANTLGKQAKQVQTLQVSNGCALEWFPQENIFFNNTHSHLTTRIELENNAKFMGWEVNCYGRPASKESFENGKVSTRLELYRDDKPIILDGLTIDNSGALNSSTSLNSYACLGTFMSTQANKEQLKKARLSIENTGNKHLIGITLIDDILVARCLGQYAEEVAAALKLIWSALRQDTLGRDACHPRIWST